MKHLKNSSLAILAVMLLFASCSVEKRVHMSGYHIEWHKSNKSSLGKNEQIIKNNKLFNQLSSGKIKKLHSQMNNELELFASNSNDTILKSTNSDILNNEETSNVKQVKKRLNTDCDIIILKNGQEILAKVLEVGQTEIKYKNCDNQSGPTFLKNNSEIFMIKYPNGTSTVMEESKSNSSNVTVNSSSNSNTTDNSIVIAALLWFFLGGLGIHRFYLGHIGMGILYLLTGGLCGIGWFIDGILLLTGVLKPKN